MRNAECGMRSVRLPGDAVISHGLFRIPHSTFRITNKEGYVYAIVEIAGDQVRVEEGARVRVPKINAEPGETLEFSDVLLVSGGENTSIGTPTVETATVRAEVLSHGRGKKIIVFKIKRRKNYRRKNGHRQGFTDLLVRDIVVS